MTDQLLVKQIKTLQVFSLAAFIRAVGFLILFVILSGFISCVSKSIKPADEFFTPGSWKGTPVVTTKRGAIRGYADKENTFVWRGIPYAQAPVGEYRWKAPVEHKPWHGILDGRSFGSQAPQFMPFLGFVIGDEDCLFLNVWRPQTDIENLPVYVWIHGGGNSLGSANFVPDYYGHAMAGRSNVVFVSINYRLGILGWFYYPSLHEQGTKEDQSGNYAALDILCALKWIKENISSFGGDPGNVTVAGESAGAFNILSLLTSPLAVGLFHKAVIESGAKSITSEDEALLFSRNYISGLLVNSKKAKNKEEAMNLLDTMTAGDLKSFLYSRTPAELGKGVKGSSIGMAFIPAIFKDGYVFPEEGYNAFDSGTYPVKVPVIIGSNKEETKLFLSFDSSFNWKSELYAAVGKYGSMRWKAEGVDTIAASLTQHENQPPVYVYRFDWGSVNEEGKSPLPGNWGTRLGAFHSLEIPFFLGTDTILGVYRTGDLFTRKNTTSRKILSAAIMSYLASFAYTGDPNSLTTDTLLLWPAWKPGVGLMQNMIFNTIGDNLSISLWDGMLTREIIDYQMYTEIKEPLLTDLLNRLNRRNY